MKKTICCVLFALLIAAATFAAAPEPALKVKVMVALANVRSGPAADAAVVMTAESGRVFDVIDKVGDWYLISLPENKHGYLISAVVAEVAEDGRPAAPVAAPVAAPPAPQRPFDRPSPPAYAPGGGSGGGMEISLFGGYGLTSVKGASNYADIWNYQYLSSVSENTDISGTSKGGMFFGGSFSYFFTPNLGIQLSGGYLKSDVPTVADFSFSYTWAASVGGGTFNKTASWAGTGSLSVIPVSLNLVGRFGEGALKISASAGPTIFLNSFQATSNVGWGTTWYWIDGLYANQAVDALAIDAAIPKTSWSGFGFNAGLDATFMFSESLGFFVGARYYYCAPKDLPWTMVPGTYDGIFYTTITGVQYSSQNASDTADLTTAFKVNPSFFQITGGIKIVI